MFIIMCVSMCESLYKRARLCGYWCVCVRVFVTIMYTCQAG